MVPSFPYVKFLELNFAEFLQKSQVLQNNNVNLKTCADLYASLTLQLCNSRDEFERYKAASKNMLQDAD